MNTESPPAKIVDRLIEMLPKRFSGSERRGAERVMVMVPANVVQLNSDYERVSEPKPAIVCDISHSGVAVWTYEKFDAPFLLLKFGERYDNMEMVFSLIRVEQLFSSESSESADVFSCAGPFANTD